MLARAHLLLALSLPRAPAATLPTALDEARLALQGMTKAKAPNSLEVAEAQLVLAGLAEAAQDHAQAQRAVAAAKAAFASHPAVAPHYRALLTAAESGPGRLN